MKFWTVLGIAALLWFVGMITGTLTPRMLMGLFFLVIMGAIFPPLGVGFGLAALVYIMLVRGTAVTGWITSKVGGGNNNG